MFQGAQVGAYRILDQIGEGGMGSVWRAEHGTIGRKAAVKLLHGEYANRHEIVQRFFNEARAATQISDPGIIQIFDFGTTPEGRAYIVMELLDGEALDRRLGRSGKLSLKDALRIMRQVASTLGAAHAAGIVHRDLKPENIFMVRDPEVPGGERAKILDFGIAKLTDNAGVKTQTHAVMGTPQFMSPEQCRGSGGVDARSDVYALGCVLMALITGAPPFEAAGHGDLIVMHIMQPPPTLSSREPHIPPAVDALVQRCLAKNPAERFASGTELAQALGILITSTSQPPGYVTPALGYPSTSMAMASATNPTTLSGSASQTGTGTMPPAGSRSRRGVFIAAVAGVALVGGIVAIALVNGDHGQAGGSKQEVAATGTTGSDTKPADVAPVNAKPAEQAQVATPPPPPDPAKLVDAAPAQAKVSIEIASVPPGAQVFVGVEKQARGATPYVLEMDKGEASIDIRLEQAGYQPKKTKVSTAEDTKVALTLDKVRKVTRPAPSSSDSDDTMNPFAHKK